MMFLCPPCKHLQRIPGNMHKFDNIIFAMICYYYDIMTRTNKHVQQNRVNISRDRLYLCLPCSISVPSFVFNMVSMESPREAFFVGASSTKLWMTVVACSGDVGFFIVPLSKYYSIYFHKKRMATASAWLSRFEILRQLYIYWFWFIVALIIGKKYLSISTRLYENRLRNIFL